MGVYVPFTEEEKLAANAADIVTLLKSMGETVKKSGSEYEWLDRGQKVTIRGNLWFHQYERVGGNAVDFLRKFFDFSYPQAVTHLLKMEGREVDAQRGQAVEKHRPAIPTKAPRPAQTTPFVLPPANDNMRRVFAYLIRQRGLDREIVYSFVQKKMLYESQQYHNAVFVGYDKDGTPRHAHRRGTASQGSFKGNVGGSQPEYSFHWTGISDRIYLFEAPIDLMSFLSLHPENWKQHSYAAACSVSDIVLFHALEEHPNLKKVFLCLDNDEAGQQANQRIAKKLLEMGVDTEILVPQHKDWNEDLIKLTDEQEETPCQGLVL